MDIHRLLNTPPRRRLPSEILETPSPPPPPLPIPLSQLSTQSWDSQNGPRPLSQLSTQSWDSRNGPRPSRESSFTSESSQMIPYHRPLKNNTHLPRHVAIVSELKQPSILISHQSEYARSTAIQSPRSYELGILDLPHNTKLTVAGSQRSPHPHVTGLSSGSLNHPLTGMLPSDIYGS